MEQQAELSQALQASQDGHEELGQVGSRRASKTLPNSQGLTAVILSPSALVTGDSVAFITSGARIPSCVPEGLCSSHQLHMSFASPTPPSFAAAGDGRVQEERAVRAEKQMKQGGLFRKGIP